MADLRGIDNDPGWINRKFRELERMIEGLRSERRAASTSVDTGSFRVTAEGQEIFRIGDMEFGDRGLIMRREDGSRALEIRKMFGPDIGQAVAIRDGGENSVVETDALFGGLRAPYLEHPFQPYAATSGAAVTCGPYGLERTSTSGTFETVFVYDGRRQNPFLWVRVAVKPSDATTSAEVRVVDLGTGAVLPLFLNPGTWLGTVAAGSTTFTVTEAGQLVVASATAGQSQRVRLGVQVRRTAGAGTLTVAVPTSIGG